MEFPEINSEITIEMIDRFKIFNAESTFLIDPEDNRQFSVKEIISAIRGAIEHCREIGLSKNQTIGIALEPSPEFISYYLASVALGLRTIVISPDDSSDEIQFKHDELKFGYLLTRSTSKNSSYRNVNPKDVDLLVDIGGERRIPEQHEQHELIIYTSGSTGTPKPVKLTLKNLLASARASHQRVPTDKDDLWLSPLPVYHIGGIAPLYRCLLSGATLVNCIYSVETILAVFRRHDVTHCSLVPTMLHDLLEQSNQWNHSPLEVLLVGGATVPYKLRKRAKAENLPIHPTYGMTETSSQIATALPSESLQDKNIVGKPLEGFDVRIDPNDHSINNDTVGEIIVSGEAVTSGYLNRPQANQTKFDGQDFRTGDLGYIDEEGYLYVLDRIDDTVIRGGKTIDPREVKQALEGYEGISKAFVFGMDDERLGNLLCAGILTDQQHDVSINQIKKYIDDHMNPAKSPDKIKLLDSVPKTDSGTLDREKIETIFLDD